MWRILILRYVKKYELAKTKVKCDLTVFCTTKGKLYDCSSTVETKFFIAMAYDTFWRIFSTDPRFSTFMKVHECVSSWKVHAICFKAVTFFKKIMISVRIAGYDIVNDRYRKFTTGHYRYCKEKLSSYHSTELNTYLFICKWSSGLVCHDSISKY